MGRYSERPKVYTYDKFQRMKEFYAEFGKDWKKKVRAATAHEYLNRLIAMKLEHDPLIDDKIARVNVFYLYCSNSGDMSNNLEEFEKQVKLGEDGIKNLDVRMRKTTQGPTR